MANSLKPDQDDLGILSKTEELLGCSLKDSLNNSVTKQVGESGDTICRSPDYSDPKDVATAIRAVLETERLGRGEFVWCRFTALRNTSFAFD